VTTLIGYARVAEWEHRLLEREPDHICAPLTLDAQTAALRRATRASNLEMHSDVLTDAAPGGLTSSFGPSPSDDVARPGLERLQALLAGSRDAAVFVYSIDRLSSFVGHLEWLLGARSGAPRVVTLAEDISTIGHTGLQSCRDFLQGAASERSRRRSSRPSGQAAGGEHTTLSLAFEHGVWWERTAHRVRAHDSLEARRVAGLPYGRPSLSITPQLGARLRSMRNHGMTLQAIADTLNAEGVPTIRGGARWRRSSLQHLPVLEKGTQDDWFP
jgi:hypothetical protein